MLKKFKSEPFAHTHFSRRSSNSKVSPKAKSLFKANFRLKGLGDVEMGDGVTGLTAKDMETKSP